MTNFILENIATLCRPGIAIDAGANFGLYAEALCAVPGAKVIAFEPFIATFVGMCNRLAIANNGLPPRNFMTYNVALGAAFGTATITVPIVGEIIDHESASLAKAYDDLPTGPDAPRIQLVRQQVVVAPLDSFEFHPVTFMKVDVEGLEMDVLQGAERTITRSHPILLVEIEERHRKNATFDVPEWLIKRGYRGFFRLASGIHDFTLFDRAAMHVAPRMPGQTEGFSSPYINEFIFVHSDDDWGMQQLHQGPLGRPGPR